MKLDDIAPWISMATFLAIFLTAIANVIVANATKEATRGTTFLGCLDKYLAIMKDRTKAIEESSPKLAEDFYRELFDLQWSEFHLWQENVIPDDVMKVWLTMRGRNYAGDEITIKLLDGSKVSVKYKNEWEKLKSEYFERDDPFVRLLDAAHAGEITDMARLKEDTRE